MDPDWPLAEANPSDSNAIASLFALSWTSPFTRLQFGNIDTHTLATAMAPRIRQQMEQPNMQFMVVRDPTNQEAVAVAQWTLPAAEDVVQDMESADEKKERQQFEDEAFRKSLPENSNRELVVEFTVGLRELRQRVLQGRRHFLLENLATHPDFRGKGLARRLIEWTFSRADEMNVLVYLETASDNPAMRLYQRLGFEEKDHYTIDDLTKFVTDRELEMYGADRRHTHVAFIKSPKRDNE